MCWKILVSVLNELDSPVCSMKQLQTAENQGVYIWVDVHIEAGKVEECCRSDMRSSGLRFQPFLSSGSRD
jgi:hypothetical protein